jgi:hypothetical protein
MIDPLRLLADLFAVVGWSLGVLLVILVLSGLVAWLARRALKR